MNIKKSILRSATFIFTYQGSELCVFVGTLPEKGSNIWQVRLNGDLMGHGIVQGAVITPTKAKKIAVEILKGYNPQA